jgi:ornithine cyclodeaminase
VLALVRASAIKASNEGRSGATQNACWWQKVAVDAVRHAVPIGSEYLPFIGGDAIRDIVSMADAIAASRTGFLADARREVVAPLRSSLCDGRVLIMPAEHTSGSGVIKIINTAPRGGESAVPGIDGAVLWIDEEPGRVGALLDVTALTALRTGAASGLATSALAPPDATVLAMIGSGVQAMDQIAAVCTVRPITTIRIYSRNAGHSLKLRDRVRVFLRELDCQAVETASDAIRGADVVCTATRSSQALFKAEDISSRAHINAVGAYRPDMCEIPSSAFRLATTVVVDQVSAALAEAGDVIQAVASKALHLDQLVELGSVLDAPRFDSTGVTIFKSVGIAAQDWSMAELIVRLARESGRLPT